MSMLSTRRVRRLPALERARCAPGVSLFCLGLAALISGCYASPIAPHPTVVVVPHPDQADPALDVETLREMYTASPDVDPDGLGAMDFIWDQSYATLIVRPLIEKNQELAGLAYARSERQQSEALSRARWSVDSNVIIDYWLIGDFAQMLDLKVFEPEGVYAINDLGEKYFPIATVVSSHLLPQFRSGRSDFGTTFAESYGTIYFPRQALIASTKSLSLYLATPNKRLRFTWVFDPDYAPPQGQYGGRRRHWNSQ